MSLSKGITRFTLSATISLFCFCQSTVLGAPAKDSSVQSEHADKTDGMPYTVPEAGVLFLSFGGDGELIWDISRVDDRERTNLEFPYLIRFKGQWYCSFREGDRHGNDPSGRARVITSKEGKTWETATLLEWHGGDIRDPRLSVTPDGKLMLNTSIYVIGEQRKNPEEWEQPGKRQSVTWLSENGKKWTGPYACPTGFDTWRWDVAWHRDYGYSVGYSGKDRNGRLYRTQDGKKWEVLVEDFFPRGGGTEASLTFGKDGAAYCLLRGGSFYGRLGIAKEPPYKEWKWHPLRIDAARNGELESGAEYGRRTGSIVGGQKLLTLNDGRIVAATAKGGVSLFWVDPEARVFTRFAHMSDGVSYPGLVEYNGQFWMTCSQRAVAGKGVKSGIYLIRINIPSKTTLKRLIASAGKIGQKERAGFGAFYRRKLLRSVQQAERVQAEKDRAVGREEPARRRLLNALQAYRQAVKLREHGRGQRTDASVALEGDLSGFLQGYGEGLREQLSLLTERLTDDAGTIPEVRDAIAQLESATADLRKGRSVKKQASQVLDAAGRLGKQSAAGFARLFQIRLAKYAADLKRTLDAPAASTKAVRKRIIEVRNAADTYEAVDKDVPLDIVRITETPHARTVQNGVQWRQGALMNVTVTDNDLVLDQNPLLSFGNGGTRRVMVKDPAVIADVKAAFTISVWAVPESTERSYRTLIGKGGRDAAFSIRHARTVSNNNRISVRLFKEGEPHPNAPYVVGFTPDDPKGFDYHWHHYAVTFDGDTVKLFLDGRRVGSGQLEGNVDFSEGDLCFGAHANRHEPWKGYIADVSVWAKALSPDAVAALMHRQLRGDETGLVGYWPMNEGEGEVVRDKTENGNHGQIINAEWERLPVRKGWRLPNPIQIKEGLDINACSISWDAADTDGNAGVSVLYGVTDNAETLPDDWYRATSGIDIIKRGGVKTLAGRCLWLKQVLTSTASPSAPPRLHRMMLRLE